MTWLVASEGARTPRPPEPEVGGHDMTTGRVDGPAGVLHAVMPGEATTACGMQLSRVRVWPTPWPGDVGGLDCTTCAVMVAASLG